MSAVHARPPASPPSAAPQPLNLDVWGGTDQGRARPQNEDTVWPDGPGKPLPDGSYLLLVADGVGGAQAGAAASRIVADEIVRHCQSVPLTNPGQVLAQAVQAANTAVYNYVTGSPSINEAASTVTVALVKEGKAHVANVGDSRTYLIRGRSAKQLTRDHTLTQQKIELGRISQSQADLDEDRNVITRSLGSNPTVQVDVFPPLSLQPGDTLLLCSDGLTDMLYDTDIARVGGRKRPQTAVGRLIAEANQRGGHDNISVVIGRIPDRPALSSFSTSAVLTLFGGLLLVAAILLVVGGLLLDRASAPPSATDTPPALVGAVSVTATSPPTMLTPSATPPPQTVIAVSSPERLPTSTPLPTYTPAPIPTLVGPPPAPLPTEEVPGTASGQPTPTSVRPVTAPLGAPILQDPSEGASALKGMGTTFKWRWHGELAEGWGFEVRIWREEDPDHYGAFDAQELMKYLARQPDGAYAVSLLVEGAYSVRQHGGGDYYWTVAVVQLNPYTRIGQEAPPRRLRYTIPGPSEEPEKPELPIAP